MVSESEEKYLVQLQYTTRDKCLAVLKKKTFWLIP